MRGLVVFLLLPTACETGWAWNQEVAALDGLRADATTGEFLSSPAMDELLAALDESAPAIRRGLKSKSASVRSRCLYIALTNHLEGVDEDGWRDDPSPQVRAVVADFLPHVTVGPLAESPEVQAVRERRPLDFVGPPRHLPPPLRERRLNRIYGRLADPSASAEQRESARRCLIAELVDEGRAERFLEELRAVPPDQPARLELMLEIGGRLWRHEAALAAIVLDRVGEDAPLPLLREGMRYLARLEEGRARLRRLAERHPEAEIRAYAASILAQKN